MIKTNKKTNNNRLKKKSVPEDMYQGVHPELAQIGRVQNAKPMKDIKELYISGWLEKKSAMEIDADIRKLREI